MKHKTSKKHRIVGVRKESRVGMTEVEYRSTCACGFQEKALTRAAAMHRLGQHIKHNV